MNVYALTPNGREIREFEVGPNKFIYSVQPKDDNYWLACRTPYAALQAFHTPHRYHAASDRLKAKYPGIVS